MSAAAYMYSQMLQRNIYIYGVYAIGQAEDGDLFGFSLPSRSPGII